MLNNKRPTINLTGASLTISDIVAVGIGEKRVTIDEKALTKCRRSRQFLEARINARDIIYGVNTSFGPMCNKIINEDQIETLQHNLIRSHAAGLGDPIDPDITRAIMVIRLNTLLKGYSGVRVELLYLLRNMINSGMAPYIPASGSVGASGDLIHLAHLALAIIGEGEVYTNGRLTSTQAAFSEAGLEPLTLSYKEGLALINGTAAMTGLGAFALYDARKLLNVACVTAAFAMEIFGGIDDAFDKDLHRVKPHSGQVKIAQTIRNLISGSGNITPRHAVRKNIRDQETVGSTVFETSINVQDVYSIRCTPQVLAPVKEAIDYAVGVVECEANSVNDNPIIFAEKEKILHGGNFHGQSVAFAMDMLAVAVSTLCNLCERRINKLLDPKLNEGLPEHLIPGEIGLTMGFMGAQYLATSTTAENRNLASPMSVNSISCNASNQDVVSMGTVAARKVNRMIRNAKHVLTLEVLANLQALSFRNADKLGSATGTIHTLLAGHFKSYDDQRIFHGDLVSFRKLLFSSRMFNDLSDYCD